jgi:hypothetical protein
MQICSNLFRMHLVTFNKVIWQDTLHNFKGSKEMGVEEFDNINHQQVLQLILVIQVDLKR